MSSKRANGSLRASERDVWGKWTSPESVVGFAWRRTAASLAWLPMFLFAIAVSANAASITATPLASQINVGERVSVEIRLQLEPGESASVFQSTFSVSSSGLITVDPSGFGTTWSSPVGFPLLGNGDASTATVSLLADDNRTDHDLVATLSVLATSVGTLALALDSDVLLQRDPDVGVDLVNIPVSQGSGSLLAEITVVPEPSAALLIGLGISGLAWRRRGTAQPHHS